MAKFIKLTNVGDLVTVTVNVDSIVSYISYGGSTTVTLLAGERLFVSESITQIDNLIKKA